MKKKDKPLIGISSCLLGENVRYNRGSTMDKWITRQLSKYVDFYPVCPEVEMGLGVPRDEIHLYYKPEDKNSKKLYLRNKKTKQDITELAQSTYQKMNEKMQPAGLDGFILMRKSPSCGISNVKTVSEDEKGNVKLLQGLYAKNVDDLLPEVPKIDSGRLHNDGIKEHFIKNVYAHYRFSQLEPSISALQEFHKYYKYILMEHSQMALKQLGQIVANSKKLPIEEVIKEYRKLFFKTLEKKASVNNRYNTLMHVMGYFKKHLTSEDKEEVLSVLKEYRSGLQSYVVPLNLFQFFVKKYNVEYLEGHYYFSPYPRELKLHLAV